MKIFKTKLKRRSLLALAVTTAFLTVQTLGAAGIASKQTVRYGTLSGRSTSSGGSTSITKNPDEAIVIVTAKGTNSKGATLLYGREASLRGGLNVSVKYMYSGSQAPEDQNFTAYGAHEVQRGTVGPSDVVYTAIKVTQP